MPEFSSLLLGVATTECSFPPQDQDAVCLYSPKSKQSWLPIDPVIFLPVLRLPFLKQFFLKNNSSKSRCYRIDDKVHGRNKFYVVGNELDKISHLGTHAYVMYSMKTRHCLSGHLPGSPRRTLFYPDCYRCASTMVKKKNLHKMLESSLLEWN